MSLSDLITIIPNVGVAAIILWLFLGGKLHSDAEFNRLMKENEKQAEALERARQALEVADARSEAGVMAAQIVARALHGRTALDIPEEVSP